MIMEKVTVIIERAEHNYSAYLKGIDGIVTTSDTVERIRSNIREAIDLYIEVAREDGSFIPEPLRGDFELEFEMDASTILNYYDGIFGKPALEKITGINQKQLWHYAMGKRSPRPATREKINRGLHNLGQELLMLHI